MIIVLMGIQGCGKGTQAKLLSTHKKWVHVNLGAMFRKEIKARTSLGKEIKHYIEEGRLVPDEYVYQTIEKALGARRRGFIFDGFPRTLDQAEYLMEKHAINLVVNLEMDDSIAEKRMLARRICTHCHKDYNLISKPPIHENKCDECQSPLLTREDDSIDIIRKRISLFHQETKPLEEFFRKKNLLISIDADDPIEIIEDKILKEIDKL